MTLVSVLSAMLQQVALVNSQSLKKKQNKNVTTCPRLEKGEKVNLKVIDTQVGRCLPSPLEDNTKPNGAVY